MMFIIPLNKEFVYFDNNTRKKDNEWRKQFKPNVFINNRSNNERRINRTSKSNTSCLHELWAPHETIITWSITLSRIKKSQTNQILSTFAVKEKRKILNCHQSKSIVSFWNR